MNITDQIAHDQNIYGYKFSHETIKKKKKKISFVVFSITDFHMCVHTVPLFLSSFLRVL